MSNPTSQDKLQNLFSRDVILHGNLINCGDGETGESNQRQTTEIFSDKWQQVDAMAAKEKLFESQRQWFLELYGFADEASFGDYLKGQAIIVDAGCGLGYKAAWFAELAPHATVIGIDISEAAHTAAENYAAIPNLFFLRGDIADTGLRENAVDLVVCDQVIMHTEDPGETFRHLAGLTRPGHEFACYVYAKKALPRELIDDHFRTRTHDVTSAEMWEMSAQLTELGKRLSELNISFEAPDIPLLGIKGGEYDLQRFIYWNFIKCFWNPDWGFEMSTATNYDWYAPSNAKRYSREEFLALAEENGLATSFLHEEEACYSARFKK